MRRKKAYSYLRFSSPEQAKGDSFRRQSALAIEYAKAHNLDLDESLTFHDLGVSAFRGANSETGQLSTLLDAVKSGLIPKNSVILVESLDRISRQAARKALRAIESIVELGVSVVTLNDGREYTIESLDNDPINLLMAILTFIRANEESVIKSQRIAAAWDNKRKLALEKPITKRCPTWVEFSNKSQSFVLKKENAKVVRQIYKLALKGESNHTIVRHLNENRVPTFSDVRTAKYWHTTSISLLLKNPAVIGTISPQSIRQLNGKIIKTALQPIENYYPAVISDSEFRKVQEIRKKADQNSFSARQALPISNIFARLGRCVYCQNMMTYNARSLKTKYYICRNAQLRAGCSHNSVRYKDVEDSIIKKLPKLLNSPALMAFPRIASVKSALKALLIAKDLNRPEINRLLLSVLISVVFHFEKRQLILNWKHGGTSLIDEAFSEVKRYNYRS